MLKTMSSDSDAEVSNNEVMIFFSEKYVNVIAIASLFWSV